MGEPLAPVIVDVDAASDRPVVIRVAAAGEPVEARLTRAEAERHTAAMVDALDLLDAAAEIAQCTRSRS